MFISIRYGVDDVVVLNPDCASLNFMLHLKAVLSEKGVYTEDDISELDICDDQGLIRNLRKLQPMERVTSAVSNKETYVPVQIQTYTMDNEEITAYKLLLLSEDKSFDKLKAKLENQKRVNRLFSPDKHPGQGKGSGKEGKNASNKRQKDTDGLQVQTKAPSRSKSKILKH